MFTSFRADRGCILVEWGDFPSIHPFPPSKTQELAWLALKPACLALRPDWLGLRPGWLAGSWALEGGTDRWMDGWMDGRTDGQTDGPTHPVIEGNS